MRRAVLVIVIGAVVVIGAVSAGALLQQKKQPQTYEATNKDKAILSVSGFKLTDGATVSYDASTKTVLVAGTVINETNTARTLAVNVVLTDKETGGTVLAYSATVSSGSTSRPTSFVLSKQVDQPVDTSTVDATLSIVAAQ